MTKSQNGRIEKRRLEWLVADFNKKLASKDPTLKNFLQNVGIDINDIEEFNEAGGRGNKYDFTIKMKDGTLKTVEHKSIKETTIDPDCPWNLNSIPQILNAPYNLSEVSQKFCEYWHTEIIPILIILFPILPEPPSLEDWKKFDASAGSVKTDFGKCLKEVYGDNSENEGIIKYISKESFKCFFQDILDNQPSLFTDLEGVILDKMNECLSQKNLWLNANYETTESLEPKHKFLSLVPKICSLKLNVELNEDSNEHARFNLTYNLSSNPSKIFNGSALLRWGNTTGVANIRWNLK